MTREQWRWMLESVSLMAAATMAMRRAALVARSAPPGTDPGWGPPPNS